MQVADLRARQDDINIERAQQIEEEIRHDLMAEIRTYAEQCPVGGPIIHLGATSMDVLDNVDALRLRTGLDQIIERLKRSLAALAARITDDAGTPAIAFTHIQPAEPTTVGYRFAQHGQDLLADLEELQRVRKGIRGKGIKGAVGTSASYDQLLSDSEFTPRQLEERVMQKLDLHAFEAATQTYPRKQDWLVVNALAGLCASLHKFAFDLRILQSPPFGEWSEPFGSKQVGSSAMPFKRNPIAAENIDSLTRQVAALPRIAWDNSALNLLERTLDDSANRRLYLPEAFLLTDEVLVRCLPLIEGITVWPGPHRPQPARLRRLRRHRTSAHGSSQSRRRPPAPARADSRTEPCCLEGPARRKAQSPGRQSAEGPAYHRPGTCRSALTACCRRQPMWATRPNGPETSPLQSSHAVG